MPGIEEMLEKAAETAQSEKLMLPFSHDSLNTAYVLMRDQYSSAQQLFVPDYLRKDIDDDCLIEMGEAEKRLHSFMGTLIEHFWDGQPVEISMVAKGRCPLHPEEHYTFRNVLDNEAVGKIETPDYVLTSETIGKCPKHPEQQLYADVSQLEYLLKSSPEGDNGVLKFQSRIKRTSMIHKLTRNVLTGKRAPDFRGGRVICKDFSSYVDASKYLLDRVASNGTIDVIPLSDALEEHVAHTRHPSAYLNNLLRENADVLVKQGPYYESLHLLLRYSGVPVELQCRDIRMHEEAEKGLAAHAEYKENELQKLIAQYPDYWEAYAFIGGVYKALMPEGFRLFQAPFLPLAHNLESLN